MGIPERAEPVQPLQPPMPIMQPQVPDDNEYPLLDHLLPIDDVQNINHFETLITTDPEANRQFVSKTLLFKKFVKKNFKHEHFFKSSN